MKAVYRQAKYMYRYCPSECVLVLSVPCILTVLGIAIVIEHVSRKRYIIAPTQKVAVVKYEAQNRSAICSLKKYVIKFTDAKASKQSTQEEEQAN